MILANSEVDELQETTNNAPLPSMQIVDVFTTD
jgi:hypothetical protein